MKYSLKITLWLLEANASLLREKGMYIFEELLY